MFIKIPNVSGEIKFSLYQWENMKNIVASSDI